MLMNVGVVQMQVFLGEKAKNFRKAENMIERVMSSNKRVDVILLPELWSTGYALDKIKKIATLEGEEEADFLGVIAKKYRVWIGGSVVASTRDGYTNRFLLINPEGEVWARYDKVHLFRLMDEDRYFLGGKNVGMFKLNEVPVGVVICYDIRFCELVRKIALLGAEVLLVSAEWPAERILHWRTLLMARAIENQMFVVSSNACGWTGTTHFGGHSMVVDPWGNVLYDAGEKESVSVISIDIEEVNRVRGMIPVFRDRVPEVY